MIELEKTYLAKYIPDGLSDCPHKEIFDIYFPQSAEHPVLRLRKNGNKFEMTKKEPIDGDTSRQEEQTIILTEAEFVALSQVAGKRVRKIRYEYPWGKYIAEVDVFQDDLAGLVLVDVEFPTVEEKENFSMPEFCLADVTSAKFTAGGMLCGKGYVDIETELERWGYEGLKSAH